MNILLVEDEPPILNHIQLLIQSFGKNYTVYGTALNGKEAIDLLTMANEEIHIMITDLHIPVIDGIELITYVKERYPSMQCIILTGYSEFEYARKAIQLNVYDYLLKPVNELELEKLLKSLYEKIYLNKLTADFYHYDSTNHKKATESQILITSKYVVTLICIGSFPVYSTIFNSISKGSFEDCELNANINSRLDAVDSYWIIDGKTPCEKIILFTFNNKEEYQIKKWIHTTFQYFFHLPFPVTVATQYNLKDISDIGPAMQHLRNFLSKHTLIGKTQILTCQTEHVTYDTSYLTKLKPILESIKFAFNTCNTLTFQKDLKLLLLTMNDINLTQNNVCKCLFDLIYTCLSQWDCPELERKVNCSEYIGDAIMLSDSYSSLYENLWSLFLDFFEYKMNPPMNINHKDAIMYKLDSYICDNYRQSISTSSLAEEFSFSPAYLSKMFREYKHMSPSEYIVHLRIEKAKKLLTTTNPILIKDVSTYIGYEDSLYFSKVFKKVVGISPKQYIKNN